METFEVFLERMSNVEKTRENVVGRAHQGHTRAIFNFEGAVCCLESRGYRTTPANTKVHTMAQVFWVAFGPEPSDYWWCCWCVNGKGLANQISKHYNGEVQEVYYPPETGSWWHIRFDQFEDLIRWVYDRMVTGEFYKRFPGAAMHEDKEEDDG